MKLKQFISAYRWPIILSGLILMSFIAQAVLVYVATRPDVPLPIKDYYETSLRWDQDMALKTASAELGWSVIFKIPKGVQYSPKLPRPVDVQVQDSRKRPVEGLNGRLLALRPANSRLNTQGELMELPHAPGHYRTLLRLPARGVWDLNLEAQRGELRFLSSQRVELGGEAH